MPKQKQNQTKTPKTAATQGAPENQQGPGKSQQGNIMVARTGDVREVTFQQGMTVKEALAAAQFTLDGASEVRVNSKPCKDMNTQLTPGDQVLIIGRIRGA